jgi:hypothetical protein
MKTIPFTSLHRLFDVVCRLHKTSSGDYNIDLIHSEDAEYSRISYSNNGFIYFRNLTEARNFLRPFGFKLHKATRSLGSKIGNQDDR